VEGKEKLLNLKLDGLNKHLGKRKSLVVHLGVAVGEYYQSLKTNIRKMRGSMLFRVHSQLFN